ncbi:50S ribosomal protein L11 methyltransferase [Blastochloris viridis]|uniref:Ribosomal protein L11 methyltransferase n=1 Tax=Blastochloris viridis TaxID=1079 RepID=A0A0H5BBD8_BLAVI|nr:50S ribosomal protein L11 methyltransferase [Blastochloris viridis]ALK10492.1 Ribosomal protein L11 methyltransferase [Blastochloris viridis]BAR99562.1 ribosomal protein L11 methyltransferase [Blastochloris viridis]CUU43154.1 Ribosomal protein L11 methyltransferase [Blastochloris viridis]
MREGLQPVSPSTIARLLAREGDARRVADLIGESFDEAETAVAAFELPDESGWTVEIYFANPPIEAAVRDLVAHAAGNEAAAALQFEALSPKDWVAASLDGLKPVRVGRIVVHGAHDRARVPANALGIEIEAALAFGTGHHGTTRGCLTGFDGWWKARPARRASVARRRAALALDVGTGTGVLALAAARTAQQRVIATDIDHDAVTTARANVRFNKAGALVKVVHAGGLDRAEVMAGGPYQLVFANILMRPLIGLAPAIRRQLAPGARVILSGLLPAHARAVVAAYRGQGLRLLRRRTLEGWVTLDMELPGGR